MFGSSILSQNSTLSLASSSSNSRKYIMRAISVVLLTVLLGLTSARPDGGYGYGAVAGAADPSQRFLLPFPVFPGFPTFPGFPGLPGLDKLFKPPSFGLFGSSGLDGLFGGGQGGSFQGDGSYGYGSGSQGYGSGSQGYGGGSQDDGPSIIISSGPGAQSGQGGFYGKFPFFFG